MDVTENARNVVVGDWLCLLIDDPNGPLLGLVGQVHGWNDDTISIVPDWDRDSTYGPVHVPWSTIRDGWSIDGPVTGPIEFDPNRPTT